MTDTITSRKTGTRVLKIKTEAIIKVEEITSEINIFFLDETFSKNNLLKSAPIEITYARRSRVRVISCTGGVLPPAKERGLTPANIVRTAGIKRNRRAGRGLLFFPFLM